MIRKILLVLLVGLSSQVSAAMLQVEAGILTGASGVMVNGTSYDVRFIDGTCVQLYSGCSSDAFTFHTQSDAVAASIALLDQVFLNTYDTSPELIKGCTNSLYCFALTAYESVWNNQVSDFLVSTSYAWNRSGDTPDSVTPLYLYGGFSNTNIYSQIVYADWSLSTSQTEVPEPAPLVLTFAGLVALAMARRKSAPRT